MCWFCQSSQTPQKLAVSLPEKKCGWKIEFPSENGVSFKTTDRACILCLLVNLFNLEFPAKGADNSSKKCLWLQMNTHVIVFAKTMNKAKAPRKNFAEQNRGLVSDWANNPK